MLIVTGTKRSGTSLWMQLLISAGYKHVGTKFPRNWEEKLKAANPNGFYESALRKGVYWETNPHPETGRYLHPKNTSRLLAKVFIPGLVKSDHAFLGRVVCSVRPWQQYSRSVRKMRHLESQVFEWATKEKQPHYLPPELEWLKENFMLVRDLRVRGYPHRVVPHSQLMTSPEATLAKILAWVGGDASKAPELAKQIDPALYRNRNPQVSAVLKPEHLALLDTWQACVEAGDWGNLEGLKALNEAWTTGLEKSWFEETYRWDDPRVAGEEAS